MRIYNTETRTKEELHVREPGKVAMYACGPTVYNHIHIGNARTFLIFDVIRRYLSYSGYEVTFVQNITDVDDKIINRAHEEGCTPAQIAEKYTEAFIDVMHRFGIADPDIRPKATEEIPSMIELIELLIERGHAYEADGDVYFSVRSDPDYCKLSGRDIDELQAGARVDVDERKRDPLDFAMWKAAKPGEPSWDSPWGPGRPGWHLECSAMAHKYLGLPLDIHGGGSDLVFPHHENETAQAEAAWGTTFANLWVHVGMLRINSEKMSKSLGNFLLLKDVLDTCDPAVLRLLMLQTAYRSPLDFSDERLAEAATSYDRIANVVRNLDWAAGNAPDAAGCDVSALVAAVADARRVFVEQMDDDFNTAGALAAVFELVTAANTFLTDNPGLSEEARDVVRSAAATIGELLGVLGITLPTDEAAEDWPPELVDLAKRFAGYEGSDAHEALDALLAARDAARAERRFDVADGIRDGLAELDFTIEDTAMGARVSHGS
ncbi:MAG: cysteine--tRNA ligase [Coriobacteriaceae bacterium]|nr:cysteine--tRNA ligase [Coriobacteriaceae bacterium]